MPVDPKAAFDIEFRAMRLAMYVALVMAVVGVGFSFAANSQAILFDGLFNLLLFFMIAINRSMARKINQGPDHKYHYGYGPPQEALAQGRRYLERSLELDPEDGEALVENSYLRAIVDWDWEGGLEQAARAVEMAPGNSRTHHLYSLILGYVGRHDEAIEHARRARELDPLSLIVNENLGDTYRKARLYDQAIEQLEQTLQMDPEFAVAMGTLASTYLDMEDYPKAMEIWERLAERDGALEGFLEDRAV